MFKFTQNGFYIGSSIVVFMIIISLIYNYIYLYNMTHKSKNEKFENDNHILYKSKKLVEKYKLQVKFNRSYFTFINDISFKKQIIKINPEVFVNNSEYNALQVLQKTFKYISYTRSKSSGLLISSLLKILSFLTFISSTTFLLMSWWILGLIFLLLHFVIALILYLIEYKFNKRNKVMVIEYLKKEEHKNLSELIKILNLNNLSILNYVFNWYSKNIFEIGIWFKELGRDG